MDKEMRKTMIDDMFQMFRTDPDFQKLISDIVEQTVIGIANDLILKKREMDEELVASAMLVCVQEHSFPMFNAINLVVNGSNQKDYEAVENFISVLKTLYYKGNSEKIKMENL